MAGHVCVDRLALLQQRLRQRLVLRHRALKIALPGRHTCVQPALLGIGLLAPILRLGEGDLLAGGRLLPMRADLRLLLAQIRLALHVDRPSVGQASLHLRHADSRLAYELLGQVRLTRRLFDVASCLVQLLAFFSEREVRVRA